MKRKIASIKVGLFAHATEDPQKVERSFQTLISSKRAEEVPLHKRTLKGEYGNPIIYYRTNITKPEIIKEILTKIGHNLPPYEKEMLNLELERRVEKGNLYLRLDKQSAYMGRFRLCNADPIHLKIRFKNSKIDYIRSVCKELGILP